MSDGQEASRSPPDHSASRPSKRQRQNTPPPSNDANGEPIEPQSPRPLITYRLGDTQQDDPLPDKISCQNLAEVDTDGPPRVERFTLQSIQAKLAQLDGRYPPERKQRAFTATHPLIHTIRSLIRARSGVCTLCAYYEWGPIAGTHELKYCSHRVESKEIAPWLEMFRDYQASGGGPGARCTHCRFPVTLCWRTVYREEMDEEYGNEVEAQEKENVWYREVRCAWVKTVQRFVTSCMVVGGRHPGAGVSELGAHVLCIMEWNDWKGLEEFGPEYIREWLQEMDTVEGLRCPRLLKLFWLLANGS